MPTIKERDDYLKKQAQAQFAVKEEKLVEAVRSSSPGTSWHNLRPLLRSDGRHTVTMSPFTR